MITKTETLEDKKEEEVKDTEAKLKKRSGKKDNPMTKFLNDSPNPPEVGDLVEGPVIGVEKSSVFIDLHPFGTGIIYGREFLQAI